MLRPLRSAIGNWSPGAGPKLDPLAAIVAAWPQIVGVELARATRPSTITGDALVVVTASSAWSHQLSFLAPDILRALAAIPAAANIERLRFRVGRIGSPRPRGIASQQPAGTRPGAPRAELSAPTSLDEALEQIQHRFEQNRDAKHAQGWKPCQRCGVTIKGGTHCAPCAGSIAAQRAVAVQRLMYDAPWLGYNGTAAVIEALTVEEYEQNRRALLERWWTLLLRAKADGRVSADGRERKIASSFVLLQTGWEPQRITPAVVRNILGDDLMTLLYE